MSTIESKTTEQREVNSFGEMTLGAIAQRPIADLNLKTWTSELLKKAYGESLTIEELTSKSESELFKIRYFGEQDLTNIQERLKQFGFSVKS